MPARLVDPSRPSNEVLWYSHRLKGPWDKRYPTPQFWGAIQERVHHGKNTLTTLQSASCLSSRDLCLQHFAESVRLVGAKHRILLASRAEILFLVQGAFEKKVIRCFVRVATLMTETTDQLWWVRKTKVQRAPETTSRTGGGIATRIMNRFTNKAHETIILSNHPVVTLN